MKIAIIGGGAAGFFAAINVKENYPDAEVCIFEKSKKLLSKVKVSGGGRCNVTNGERSIKRLTTAYPRGDKQLKKLFTIFSTQHTMEWFEERGVPLMTQDDGCVFPVSQNSQSIIDCFLDECRKKKISICESMSVAQIEAADDQIILHFKKEENDKQSFDKVIVATGGSPKRTGFEWLEEIKHEIKDPVPSLFTFNMPTESVKELMGVVVEQTKVSIQGTKLKSDGPLLITHWGMSGPAILKLSAFGARILSENNYNFKINVNWANETNHQIVFEEIERLTHEVKMKKLSNFKAYQLPVRLWHFLLAKADIDSEKIWGDLGKKGIHKIVNFLTHDEYHVQGKTTFKEEFVTCGGVDLNDIDFKTMQSKVMPHVYFAGEVLDIDGITGGYNFQSCWTTAYIAARLG